MIDTKAPKTTATLLPGGKAIAVSPGAKIVPLGAELAPAVGVFRWQAVGDGTFRPTARIHEQHMRLQDAAEAFGIDRVTLWRLYVGKFVAGRKASPRCVQINIVSLSRHIEAVEGDPDFWTPERIKQYAEAL